MNKNYYTKFINFFKKHQLYDEETYVGEAFDYIIIK